MKWLSFISYALIILGSIGMMIFPTHFPFSTNISDLRYETKRYIGLNGYYFWVMSWLCIIFGTVIQLLIFLIQQ